MSSTDQTVPARHALVIGAVPPHEAIFRVNATMERCVTSVVPLCASADPCAPLTLLCVARSCADGAAASPFNAVSLPNGVGSGLVDTLSCDGSVAGRGATWQIDAARFPVRGASSAVSFSDLRSGGVRGAVGLLASNMPNWVVPNILGALLATDGDTNAFSFMNVSFAKDANAFSTANASGSISAADVNRAYAVFDVGSQLVAVHSVVCVLPSNATGNVFVWIANSTYSTVPPLGSRVKGACGPFNATSSHTARCAATGRFVYVGVEGSHQLLLVELDLIVLRKSACVCLCLGNYRRLE